LTTILSTKIGFATSRILYYLQLAGLIIQTPVLLRSLNYILQKAIIFKHI